MTNTNETKEKFYTTYKEAVEWLHNSIVICNNIPEVDESIWGNMRFNMYDEDDNAIDIFQWFITDCNESDVEYLEKHFGLLFTYSDKLDCYILCVDHCGTAWSYVACEVLTHGIDEYSPKCKSYKELTGLND